MDFWKIFYNLCEVKGEAPNVVAKKLNISSASVTWWKQGQRNPSVRTLKMIADYFNVSVEYLKGETDERTPKEKSPAGAELSEKDRKLVDAYHKSEPVIQSTVDRLLGIEEKVYKVKIAARNGGGIEEKTLTEEEYNRLMGLPDVEDI